MPVVKDLAARLLTRFVRRFPGTSQSRPAGLPEGATAGRRSRSWRTAAS